MSVQYNCSYKEIKNEVLIMKINEQITFLRKQRGITQEGLANALGVTNQAVSKWESAQCCPDIQLLPDIAKFFDVSVDELLGYTPVSTADDIVLTLRNKIESLPKGEDYGFAFKIASTLHTIIISKLMDPDWDTDGAIEHAGNAEWGYSCCCVPEFTTTMRRGSIFFSNNRQIIINNEAKRIASVIKPLSNAKNLKIAAALYRLTVGSEDTYATALQVSEESELPIEQVQSCIENDLAELVVEKDDAEGQFRFDGRYLNVLPIISLLDF